MTLTIAGLPFHERPVRELLALHGDRERPLHDYAGYGWAVVDRVWLGEDGAPPSGRFVEGALVLAVHTPDDGPPIGDDLELEFELPASSGTGAVLVMLSSFLQVWRPRLPAAPAVVLAVCNPHDADLARHRPLVGASALHYPHGDVTSWLDRDHDDRIELIAARWFEA